MKLSTLILMAVACTTAIFCTPANAQFGGGTQPFVGGRTQQFFGPPSISTIDSLSIPAADKAPAMPLRVYRLIPGSPPADELISVIRELVEPKTWDDGDVYLRGFGSKLIIRHRADVQKRIERLLTELRAISIAPAYRSHGPVLTSPIPVVGDK